jgi:hypothetical protein
MQCEDEKRCARVLLFVLYSSRKGRVSALLHARFLYGRRTGDMKLVVAFKSPTFFRPLCKFSDDVNGLAPPAVFIENEVWKNLPGGG